MKMKQKTAFCEKLRLLAALTLILVLIIIPQTGCSANEKSNANTGISKTGFYLDTLCTITIFGIEDTDGSLSQLDDEERQRQVLLLITDAFKLCDSYEKLLSKTIESSEISKINNAGGKPVEVSEETAELIRKGIEYGERSNGAFDITIGKATELWGFREAEGEEQSESGMVGRVPDADELREVMKHIDYRQVKLNGSAIQLADPDMELDLGGIAKGYIADKLTEFLQDRGVTSAIVDLGGNIVAIGGKAESLISDSEAESTDFTVGIKDPSSDVGELLGTLPVKDKTVVTSGTYERYFVENGKSYHHILNSSTGYPTDTDVLSVTIIADKGHSADCDGLSTSCLALGLEKGTELIRQTEGVEAIFVDTDGEIYKSSDNIDLTVY